jgi:hypothetical protein
VGTSTDGHRAFAAGHLARDKIIAAVLLTIVGVIGVASWSRRSRNTAQRRLAVTPRRSIRTPNGEVLDCGGGRDPAVGRVRDTRVVMRIIRILRRAVMMAVFGLARIVLPAFGVVPPEWLMNAGREQPPVTASSRDARLGDDPRNT